MSVRKYVIRPNSGLFRALKVSKSLFRKVLSENMINTGILITLEVSPCQECSYGLTIFSSFWKWHVYRKANTQIGIIFNLNYFYLNMTWKQGSKSVIYNHGIPGWIFFSNLVRVKQNPAIRVGWFTTLLGRKIDNRSYCMSKFNIQ